MSNSKSTTKRKINQTDGCYDDEYPENNDTVSSNQVKKGKHSSENTTNDTESKSNYLIEEKKSEQKSNENVNDNKVTMKIENGNTIFISFKGKTESQKFKCTYFKELYPIICDILSKKYEMQQYGSFDKNDDIQFRFININNEDVVLSSNTLITQIKATYCMEEGIDVIVDGGCQNDFRCYLFPTQNFIDLAIRYLDNIKADYLFPSHVMMECNSKKISIYDKVSNIGIKKNYILEITHSNKKQIKTDTIKIFIQTDEGKTIELTVNNNQPILDVKYLIYKQAGIPCNVQTLLFDGNLLQNKHTLNSYKINNKSTLNLYN
eukprot:22329_1